MLRVTIVFCVLGLAVATPPFVRSREEIQAFRNYLEGTQKGFNLKYLISQYKSLGREYYFVQFGVETLSPWGPSVHNFFAEIANRLVDVTGDRRAGGFLAQRISIAIQRGNAASILDKPNRVFSPLANPEENSGKFEGDIVLDDWMIEEMVQEYAMGRNAFIRAGTKWPNNTVIWEFAEGHFNSRHQAAVEEAIADIESHTCIKFRRREPTDFSHVHVTGAPDGCYAHVGYWATRGPHIYNLAPDTYCFRHATIVHEWMHILGFRHMHSTYNRDKYVKIEFDNVQAGFESAFFSYDSNQLSNLGVEYDYVSCLHYSAFAASRNGRPTIVALQEHEGVMGQRQYITDKDWLRINRHYDCPGAWD